MMLFRLFLYPPISDLLKYYLLGIFVSASVDHNSVGRRHPANLTTCTIRITPRTDFSTMYVNGSFFIIGLSRTYKQHSNFGKHLESWRIDFCVISCQNSLITTDCMHCHQEYDIIIKIPFG